MRRLRRCHYHAGRCSWHGGDSGGVSGPSPLPPSVNPESIGVSPDASTADPGGRDAHVHVSGTAGPRLEVRSVLKVLDFTLAGDLVRVTVHQDAPAFMKRVVEVVGFEADLGVGE